MKRWIAWLLCLSMALGLTACAGGTDATQADTSAAETAGETAGEAGTEASQGVYTAGTYTATAAGFGGDITVTVTVDENQIVSVEAVGDGETPDRGGVALEELAAAITEAGSTDVDVVAGSTITSDAMIAAVEDALRQAAGDTQTPEVKMAPGEYTAEAYGFMAIAPLSVTLTVDETSIQDIEVDYNLESLAMSRAVEERMLPEMLEYQSVAVDSVSGCTLTSNAVKSAASDALVQALEAGGSDAAALSAFQTREEKTDAQETIDVDVLVVGMGGSGCAAAMSTAEAMYENDPSSVNVLAIDKAGRFGGTSAFCGEPMAVNAPRFKEEFNNDEDYMDYDALVAAWDEYTEGDAKMDIVEYYLSNSGETIDWLYYEHGFEFNNPLTGFTAEDVYRCKYQYANIQNMEEGREYRVDVAHSMNDMVDSYFHNLIEDYEELGGEYMLEVEATEILYDEASNTVTGVLAQGADGTQYTIHANAVILASGGFAGNAQMEEEYFSQNPYYDDLGGYWTVIGMTQNDGKMIQSAIEDAGAGTYNIDMVPMVHFATSNIVLHDYPVNVREGEGYHLWYGWENTWSLNDVPTALVLCSDIPWVDIHGERFVKEGQLFSWWIAGPTYWAVWSQDLLDNVAENGFSQSLSTNAQGSQGGVIGNTPIPELYDILDTIDEMGYLIKADTIEELAQQMGVPAENLTETLAAYEGYCESGVDEEFGKDASKLLPLGDGPYYAIKGYSATFSTVGGLDVDINFNVLKDDGETPIGGLYAVGNESGGVLYSDKKPYVTYGGAALGWAFTSGRLVGAKAVEYIAGK